MSSQPKTLLTPEQYLAIEREAPCKSEYYDGEMFAMSGARRANNVIAANVIFQLNLSFRSRKCEVYPSDMRVRTIATHYTYPDVTAVCGEPKFVDDAQDTLLNPGLIVEVLSKTTEAYDRGRKFELYQSIASLREYLLLASDRMHADLYVRQSDGHWLLIPAGQPEDVLNLESVGCQIRLADLYDKVKFDSTALF